MEIGIGLPAAVPGVDGPVVLEWARRAERLGFSTLAVSDRIVYGNYEPLVTLAAAAAVTERIRLLTDVLIVPSRSNTALLAKQTATLDALSGGRLVLGVGLGGRRDDYEASGMSTAGRGKRLEAMLEEMKRIWAGEVRGHAGAIGPPPAREAGPPVLIGGLGDAAARRSAWFGEGWVMGEGTPEDFTRMANKVRAAWAGAAREKEPRLVGLCYFALGDDAEEVATSYIRDYYAWLGDPPDITLNLAVTPAAAQRFRELFANLCADELIYLPCSAQLDQVHRLAANVL
jgi:alkanesulfonate monooxygenase SsuD/methylene tetrahydromethanopterin reductase-like flavin-dependent oxidoreductase (luciferase family)